MDNQYPNQPWQGSYPPPQQPYYPAPQPWPPAPKSFVTKKPEILFAIGMLVFNVLLWNCILYGGFNLGFAVTAIAVSACSVVYLLRAGHRFDWYSGSLMGLSILTAAGFARSADGFVKLVMVLFLLTAVNLSLCLLAKKNRRAPGSVSTLLDAPRTFFILSLGEMGKSTRGLVSAAKESGSAGRKSGAVLLGLAIAVPVVAVMVFLLMRADAAFEGLMDLLPETDWREPVISVLVGIFAALMVYTRGVALNRGETPAAPTPGLFRGWDSLTVNTILGSVCLVYTVYLLSQLAYFAGGFSGLLPEEYTMAEYARRGFFEMAWLCAINLGVIWLANGVVRKDPNAPLLTRLLCLFIGIVTIFLVAAASAKMLMYIGGYGLTRLRVLTEVIMVFLGLTTAVVCLWLFVPKLPYMKVIILLALTMGCATLWADVDSQVAKYNVEAYRSGRLETVDVAHLATLSDGAVPYLQLLTGDADPEIAQMARDVLESNCSSGISDIRSWNWASAQAWEVLEQYQQPDQGR